MDPAVKEIATSVFSALIVAGMGSLQTCLIWMSRVIRKAKRDLNMAHAKIRDLEKRISDLETDIDNIH